MRVSHWTYTNAAGAWSRHNNVCPTTGISPTATADSVYGIALDGDVIYVGEAGRGLTRVDHGFTRNITQSVAYKWRGNPLLQNRTVLCLLFDSFSANTCANKKAWRQALEADIATTFYVRNGAWPCMLGSISVRGSWNRINSHRCALAAVCRYLENEGYLLRA